MAKVKVHLTQVTLHVSKNYYSKDEVMYLPVHRQLGLAQCTKSFPVGLFCYSRFRHPPGVFAFLGHYRSSLSFGFWDLGLAVAVLMI